MVKNSISNFKISIKIVVISLVLVFLASFSYFFPRLQISDLPALFEYTKNTSPVSLNSLDPITKFAKDVIQSPSELFAGSILATLSNGDILIEQYTFNTTGGQNLLVSYPTLSARPADEQKVFIYLSQQTQYLYLDTSLRGLGKITNLVELIDPQSNQNKWVFTEKSRILYSDPLLVNIQIPQFPSDVFATKELTKPTSSSALLGYQSSSQVPRKYYFTLSQNQVITSQEPL